MVSIKLFMVAILAVTISAASNPADESVAGQALQQRAHEKRKQRMDLELFAFGHVDSGAQRLVARGRKCANYMLYVIISSAQAQPGREFPTCISTGSLVVLYPTSCSSSSLGLVFSCFAKLPTVIAQMLWFSYILHSKCGTCGESSNMIKCCKATSVGGIVDTYPNANIAQIFKPIPQGTGWDAGYFGCSESTVYVTKHNLERSGATLKVTDPQYFIAHLLLLTWDYDSVDVFSGYKYDIFNDGPPKSPAVNLGGIKIQALARPLIATNNDTITNDWSIPSGMVTGLKQGTQVHQAPKLYFKLTREVNLQQGVNIPAYSAIAINIYAGKWDIAYIPPKEPD
ncbi:uncharacterized protein MELLADRAFT_109752 [Melampsora larici-populina 98AG31]|uniref:Secreted protein n=1 Tax=Melampsora larici-populina (strain 98AG31 / pathotype 3-4-7) TaxID=747676 RepID=F4RXH6_MELLP|nr:uncharacterized protein MELLADRAFT_109752 [Melampsora larici-populina 98AG31]EGG02985.1 hypothetical protein MELLADRAFT_109752 [Melampsora larici-populina 98AG31]